MKTKFILSAALLTAVSVFAQPKMFIDNTTFDWGTTPEGNDKIKHTYVVVNKGTDTLKIENIRTSCGCTVAKYDTTVAPGKTGSITAEFNKAGRTGQQERTLTVYSNDAESAQIRLTIKGFIKTPIDIANNKYQSLHSENGKVKGSVSFVTENPNMTITKAQYLLNNDSEKLVPSNVSVTLKNKSKPAQNGSITYEYDFSFSRTVEKYESGRITFNTNVKEKPSVELNVSVEPSKKAPY